MTEPVSRPLPRPGPVRVLRAGLAAMRAVPGLRGYLLLGLLLNYAAALGAGLLTFYGLYALIFRPLAQWVEGWTVGGGFWAGLLGGVFQFFLFFTQVALLGGCFLVAFLLALNLMSLWLDGVAERIVRHARGASAPAPGGGLGLGRSVRDVGTQVTLGVAALVVALVPVAGPPLSVAIVAYLFGRELRAPYLAALEGRGQHPASLRAGLLPWTIAQGALPVALGLLPVIGWLLLPLAMILAVAGIAWEGEQAANGR